MVDPLFKILIELINSSGRNDILLATTKEEMLTLSVSPTLIFLEEWISERRGREVNLDHDHSQTGIRLRSRCARVCVMREW